MHLMSSVFILAAASSIVAFEAEVPACDTLRNHALSCDAWAANASLTTGDLTEACNTEWGKKNCAQTCCASQETEGRVVRRALAAAQCDRPGSLLTEKFKPCYDTMCCQDKGFGCYKRVDRSFALCRPMGGPPEACVSSDEWTCPGRWSRPEAAPRVLPVKALLDQCSGHGAGKFKPCIQDKCCKDAGFGCFKKEGVAFAQCRPLGGPLSDCKSTDVWTCPLEWKTAEEEVVKHVDAMGEKIQQKHGRCPRGGFAGFPKFANCWAGADNCCKDNGFACFSKRGRSYAQCRPMGEHYSDCRDTDDWLCPGNWEKEEQKPNSNSKPGPASNAHPSSRSTPARSRTESDDDDESGDSDLWFYLFIVVIVLAVGYIAFDMYKKGTCAGGGDEGSPKKQTGSVYGSDAGSTDGKKKKIVKKSGSAAGSNLSAGSGTGKKKVAKKKKGAAGAGDTLPKEEHYWRQEDTSVVDGGSSEEEQK